MAGEDKRYTKWLHDQPCYCCGHRPPSQVHHLTGAGMGLRAPDGEAFALCSGCHRSFHDGRGHFRDWSKAKRRQWQAEAVRRTRSLYLLDGF